MAALIGAELAQFVRSTYNMHMVDTTLWTDSTIVVHWLRRDPMTCKPFVANRVLAIREASENGIWRHVQGIDNPADLLTRGIDADQLHNAPLWWHGPSWLIDAEKNWPISRVSTLTPEQQDALKAEEKVHPDESCIETHRSKTKHFVGVVVSRTSEPLSIQDPDGTQQSLVHRRSQLTSLLRVTAYVRRFIDNINEHRQRRRLSKQPYAAPQPVEDCDRATIPPITNIERRQALRFWIADAQRIYYSPEMEAIRADRPLANSSAIVKLKPIIDVNGFLRVGGRLANADIPEGTKHQLILPPQAQICKLIVRDAHFVTIHGGPQLMLAYLRQSYWITRGRQMVKSECHRCPTCVRYDQPENTQLMGSLPIDRVTRSECFARTGLDFAGPFVIKKQRGRTPAVDRCSKQPPLHSTQGLDCDICVFGDSCSAYRCCHWIDH